MCTYNGALHLQAQLSSIAAQTRLPDELVICDDQSSDETITIIERFANDAPFPVRLHINEKNLGSTKNFEKAISLCGGDIIALADQDDVWYRDKLMQTEALFTSEPAIGVVFTDAEVVDENLGLLGYRLWECHGFSNLEQQMFAEGKAFDLLLMRNIVTGATMAFRAKFKQLILPIPVNVEPSKYIRLIHDGWIALMISAVADIAFIHEPLMMYRQHAGQQLGGKLRPMLPTRQIPEPLPTPQPGKPFNKRIGERLKSMNKVHTDEFLIEFQPFAPIHERLSINDRYFRCNQTSSRLTRKTKHLKARALMPSQGRFSRVPFVLKELLSLRYHTYSNGLFSAVKDILIARKEPVRENVSDNARCSAPTH
ncbi:MAG: glycosyltransferase family 2 protein [Pyrinomonadaceae bacterium]